MLSTKQLEKGIREAW